ncbi:MAG: TolC family protein [Clostridiales bacterium]|nr:TolC family protein [Clostridiales bacterium]
MLKKMSALIIAFLLTINCSVFAESEISIDQTIELATEDQSVLERIDSTLEKLWDNYNAAKERKKQIESTLASLEAFEELYEKKYEAGESLTVEESIELEGYIKKYGDEPPNYTNQEMLDLFIIPRDFGYKSAYAEIEKLRNTKQTIIPGIESNVRELYNQVISFQAALDLQDSYLTLNIEQHDEMVLNYELGEIKPEDLILSEMNLSIMMMQVEQLTNNLDTLKMKFNKLIDVSITEEFVLIDTLSSVEDIFAAEPLHKSLEVYLEEALMNRAEIKNARIDYEVKEREDSIIRDFLSNELLTDRVSAEVALVEAAYNLEQAEVLVVDDVSDGYVTMMTYWKDYLLSVESYKLQVDAYEHMKRQYELGQISSMDLSFADYQIEEAINKVETNLRNYMLSIEKMAIASGIGPAY